MLISVYNFITQLLKKKDGKKLRNCKVKEFTYSTISMQVALASWKWENQGTEYEGPERLLPVRSSALSQVPVQREPGARFLFISAAQASTGWSSWAQELDNQVSRKTCTLIQVCKIVFLYFCLFTALKQCISSVCHYKAQRKRVTVYLKTFKIVSSRFSPIFLWVIVPVKLILESDGFQYLLDLLYFWKDFPRVIFSWMTSPYCH